MGCNSGMGGPKTERSKSKELKAEGTKEPKAEEIKAKESKAERIKAREPKAGGGRAKEPKAKAAKAEAPQTGEPKEAGFMAKTSELGQKKEEKKSLAPKSGGQTGVVATDKESIMS